MNTQLDNAVSATEETFHIKTIANYLPIIILCVILLIGFISWELMIGNWPIFITIIITFLYVGYVHYLQPSSFLTMKTEASSQNNILAKTLLPTPPNSEFKLSGSSNFDTVIRFGLPIIILGLGLGLGFASIHVSEQTTNYNPSVGLMTVGGIMLAVSFIIIILSVLKYTGIDKLKDFPTSKLIPLLILCITIGIPIVIQGNKIETDLNDTLSGDTVLSNEYKKGIAKTSADWMLGIGIFFQIVFFIVFGYFLWRNTNKVSGLFKEMWNPSFIIYFIIILGLVFSPSALFLSASQKGPGFNKDNGVNISNYGEKSFLVHGIIWLLASFVFIVILFGQVKQYTVYKGMMIGLCLLLCIWIFISWGIFAEQNLKTPNAADILKQDSDLSKSVYYEQLRKEVTQELKKKDPNASSTLIDKAIQDRINEDSKKSQQPTHAILGTFSFLSVFIAIFILICYNVRVKMAECANIPELSFNDLLLYTFNGQCPPPQVPPVAPPLNDYQSKIKNDKMLSNDWDKVLTDIKYVDSTAIRLSKWFSFIPFLSVIMVVMWISVLFTNVTTSYKTSDWIAETFSGDMFPRVKELIDTFFIVLIVGLILCAILLLPIVKELNAGGLDSILKFAESVQVWQFTKISDTSPLNVILAIIGFVGVFSIGLSWWWKYLNETRKNDTSLPIVPDNWGWAIAFVVILAICSMPTFFYLYNNGVDANFENENLFKRLLRQFLTTIYLVPLLFAVLFRTGIYSLASFTGIPDFIDKRDKALNTLKFWEWDSQTTDLRMFPIGDDNLKPSDVSSLPTAPVVQNNINPIEINETKVSAVGQLIKVILLIISFVILILAVVYYVYKIDADFVNKGAETDNTASGGFVTQMNSPTAHTIYVIIAIVGIAGIVAYLRDKFTKANTKTPENYLFDDFKTEDATNPLRQLAFGATHIVYVILMIIVWIYDREKDDKNRMSITGMTVLGMAILFFHYGLEFIDTLNRKTTTDGAAENRSSISDIFTNIRFIINTIFFIVLCALAYYKQHGVMVVLILAMFIFHLTKSIIGLKLLKMLWLCIIYIPCLFLDFLQSSQSVVGDTTRPIWIIIAIELLLIAILYGGPYLLNYIGASASQIVAAPVSLKQKYDTNLNTQSPQIFIYHNTGIDRTPEDKAANCPVEEKKRYNYSISGWFFLNNSATSVNKDLEIFNFGDVPSLTYNKSTSELKLFCRTLDMSGNPYPTSQLIYNSKNNYNTIVSGKTKDKQEQIRVLFDNDNELDVSVPLQKWNYFVVNYNGKTMDLFLNTKLVYQSDFIMPDIVMKPITIGDTTDNKGLNGSICNFAFHKVPLTKEQMRWTYTMLKSQNPPMIGMSTIEDEVNKVGTTEIYSK